MVQPLPKGYITFRHTNGRGKANGKPLKRYGEHQQEYQPQPEGRHRRKQVADLLDDPVRPLILIHTHDAAQEEADDTGKHPGAEHQRERIGEPLRNNLDDRSAVQYGFPPVALQKLCQPGKIPLYGRFIDPPIAFNLRPLFRRKSSSQAKDILLHRVNGRCTDQRKSDHADRQQ